VHKSISFCGRNPHFLPFGLLKKKKPLYKCPDLRFCDEKYARFSMLDSRNSMKNKEINFFYFFGILLFTITVFGRAFWPQKAKGEGSGIRGRGSGIKEDKKNGGNSVFVVNFGRIVVKKCPK
jgi:hypothetical protein